MTWATRNFGPMVDSVSEGEDAILDVVYDNLVDRVVIRTELGFSFAFPGHIVRDSCLMRFVDTFVREYEGAVYFWLGRQSYWQYTRVGL